MTPTDNRLNLMLAIQRAEASGYRHFAAALTALLKREIAKGQP